MTAPPVTFRGGALPGDCTSASRRVISRLPAVIGTGSSSNDSYFAFGSACTWAGSAAPGGELDVLRSKGDVSVSDALAEERRRLRDAEAIGRVGSWELDLRTDAVTWSPGLFALYGIRPEQFSGDYAAALGCIELEDQEKVNASIEACVGTGRPVRVRYRITRYDNGELRWIDSRGQAQYEDGQRIRIVGAIADVTEHVNDQVQAHAARMFHQAVVEASPDIIFVHDAAAEDVTWSSRSIPELLGYAAPPEGNAVAGWLDSMVHPDDREQLRVFLEQAADAPPGEVLSLQHRLLASDGTYRWFSRRLAGMHDDVDHGTKRVVGVLRDITDAVNAQDHLQHSVLHDALTGLPNRSLLMDRLEGALLRSEHMNRDVSVLFCDLDGFKRVNDTAGHAVGDQVLIEIAHRMKSVLRSGDTVGRISGDEFVVIVEPWNRDGQPPEPTSDSEDRQLAIAIAERIGEALRPAIIINGSEHVVSASIGITFGGHAPADHHRSSLAEELLQDADAAMYRAKTRGKDRFEIFAPGMRPDAAERNRIEQTLRKALRNGGWYGDDSSPPVSRDGAGLTAAYQPIFNGADGSLVGFEALARLTDLRGRSIPPDEFIPIAEETGMIRDLGARMLEMACQQLASWRAEHHGMGGVTMSVNISVLQARHPALGLDVHRSLGRTGLKPTDLILELTESALLDARSSTMRTLHGLHQEGVGIAIDDFGTGFSSLQYLVNLPLSSLKIDRSFTAGLPENKTSQKIVHAVAGLAAELDLSCVVEGVETAAQQRALPSGVLVQGYLTGRPLAPQQLDLDQLITSGSSQPTVPLE